MRFALLVLLWIVATTSLTAQAQTPRATWSGVQWPAAVPHPSEPLRQARRVEYPDHTATILFELDSRLGPAPVWAAWRSKLVRAGATLSDEHAQAAASVATVDLGGHRYFTALAVRRSSGGVLGTLGEVARVTVPMTGPCVPIPDITFRMTVTRRSMRGDTTEHRFGYGATTERSYDLDRDGHVDVLVPLPRARDPQTSCPEDTRWEIYLTRGSCGHAVGIIEGELANLPALAHASHGAPDLESTIAPRTPRDGPISLRYAFDGSHYIETERTQRQARCDVRRLRSRQRSRKRDPLHADAGRWCSSATVLCGRARAMRIPASLIGHCDVHPADCEDLPHTTCELRDHPTILSHFDPYAVVELLSAAATTAQRGCVAPAAVTERCDVHPTFAPDGHLSNLAVRDCPRRRACVARVFRAMTITPYTGDASMPSTSFQIPAP